MPTLPPSGGRPPRTSTTELLTTRAPTPAPVPSTSASAPASTTDRAPIPANVPPPPPAPTSGASSGDRVSTPPSLPVVDTSTTSSTSSGDRAPGAPPASTSTADSGSRAPAPPPAPAPDSGSRAPIPPPTAQPVTDTVAPVTPEVETFTGNAFEIGFDAIDVGKGSYTNSAIYVSKGLEVVNPAQLGLKTVEKRPVSPTVVTVSSMTETTYDDEDTQFYHGSIEYWVAKRDLDSRGRLVTSIKIPILPTGVTRVNHERLLLTEKSADIFLNDTGTLMFYGHIDTANIILTRNGVTMNQSEWQNVTETDTPNTAMRMATSIKIKSPYVGDIYTVSYNPSVSTTIAVPSELGEYSPDGLSVVDLVGDLSARLVHDQLILLEEPAENVVKSVIYLIIVLRNNTGDTSITPAVEEYTLLIGTRDPIRYSDEAF